MTKQWFALQVYTGREKWVAAQLEKAELRVLLPLGREVRKWSDRSKVLLTPLFPGYLFCNMNLQDRASLISAGVGVLRVVGRGTEPEPVEDTEIQSLQRIVESGALTETWPYIPGGSQVRIVGGSLDGVVGRFVEEKKNQRLVVSVNLLQRAVAVEIDRSQVVLDPVVPLRAIRYPSSNPLRSDVTL